MGSEPVIHDISSDEENWRETRGGRCSDRKAGFASDDDDCVILDGDPEEPVSAENAVGGTDSDDLVVVGSKGQVACRDFPHPRHLCANYDFGTTTHEKHCGQCHCYVCDELAPCVHWGDGTCIFDHCHATENSEYWKVERKLLRKPDIAPEARQAPPRLNSVPSCSTSSDLNPNPEIAPEAPSQPPPSPRLTDFNSVPSCSTISDINPNPPVGCAPNQTNLPSSSQSKNSHPSTSLHHICGSSTTFKRPGGAVLKTNGSAYELNPQIYPNQTNLQSSQNCGQLSSTSEEYSPQIYPNQTNLQSSQNCGQLSSTSEKYSPTTGSTALFDSENEDTDNPLPVQPNSIYLPEASQSLDHSHSHLNGFVATNMPQLNSSDFLQNSMPSQPQTSSQREGDNSVSNFLSNPQSPTSFGSYPYVDSTFNNRNANLQTNGSTVPNFNYDWRYSNSSPFLLNSLPSQPQAHSLYGRNYWVSNSLIYSQPAVVACQTTSYPANLDSNWRYSNSNAFLQNPLSSQPQTAYSQPATAGESNSYVDSTFHNQHANLQINGLNVPHFDSNWRSNSSNQRNQPTGSDLPPQNSSTFLQNPSQAQVQTYSQHNGDNSVSYSLSDSQPTTASESNSYLGSTFRIQDANPQINGLEVPGFDPNWRHNNIKQRNQLSGSDIPPQVHDWRKQQYEPGFSSGTNSSSLGFVSQPPWMIDESFYPMSPELGAYRRPYF